MVRHRLHVLITATLLAGLPACGGDTATPAASDDAAVAPATADAAFYEAVTDACVEVDSAVDEAESSEELPPEEAASMIAGAMRGFVADVEGLEPPEGREEQLTALLAAVDGGAATWEDGAEQLADGEDPGAVFGAGFATFNAIEATAVALGTSIVNCGEEVVVADADAAQVAVTATDYAFEVPEVDAGPTAFTMTNDGDELHFMYVVRLADGATADDFLESEGEDGTVEEEVGESGLAGTGGTAVLNADLEPGSYLMACFIGRPDGTPHAFLGMVEEFEVTG